MKKIQLVVFIMTMLLIGACSNDGTNEENEQKQQDVSEESVGFSLTGDSIEEAKNIPKEEKEQILLAFDTYISTFNEKDLDAYMETLSENTKSFDLEEERAHTQSIFNEYNLVREVSDVTIVKYAEEEAQVFSVLKSSLKQLSSGLETNESGRQVTVFTKENNEWKVSSVHYIGDDAMKQ
ncbi:DUF3225 domain-containing protein [Sporosarcina pasteurii]|uniref:Nuclear transport factor 2 family protein n=1 Tax=Sporosarcina pasteurii TaxID=1474 RepID=A0A380BG16_SPOPA|nr:DUF3225 domain-containing protein [Sporosarcina pasteurii]MDS9470299.1 DUF3225 domain-containing protein [Sporosarcina pasteurii]QBQ05987.1 DUF3225 domain-containing protein [Sporosarcina pasteurii]SUI99740.1 Uncharacterised protein [Sporosarcina pasteurii]